MRFSAILVRGEPLEGHGFHTPIWDYPDKQLDYCLMVRLAIATENVLRRCAEHG